MRKFSLILPIMLFSFTCYGHTGINDIDRDIEENIPESGYIAEALERTGNVVCLTKEAYNSKCCLLKFSSKGNVDIGHLVKYDDSSYEEEDHGQMKVLFKEGRPTRYPGERVLVNTRENEFEVLISSEKSAKLLRLLEDLAYSITEQANTRGGKVSILFDKRNFSSKEKLEDTLNNNYINAFNKVEAYEKIYGELYRTVENTMTNIKKLSDKEMREEIERGIEREREESLRFLSL